MEGRDELAVLEVCVQALFGRHLAGGRKQHITRVIGELRARTRASSRRRTAHESARFFRDSSGLQDQMQTCSYCNTQQQFERKVGDPPVDDLTERGLRYSQQLSRG